MGRNVMNSIRLSSMNYALITGASSGIGYELALQFASHGHNIVLVARNEEKLKQVSDYLEYTFKIKTLIIPVDLSHEDAADKVFKRMKENSATINYLVNNAGFYILGKFSETSWEHELKFIQLQCLTHTRLIKLFLPEMIKHGKGGILNVGSTGSFVPGPYNAVYCAAKGFVLSLSEAVAEEVSGTGVSVTALCPGRTNTDFWKGLYMKNSFLNPLMEAKIVAEEGYKRLMKGERIVIPGRMNKLQLLIIRFLPRKWVASLAGNNVLHHSLNMQKRKAIIR